MSACRPRRMGVGAARRSPPQRCGLLQTQPLSSEKPSLYPWLQPWLQPWLKMLLMAWWACRPWVRRVQPHYPQEVVRLFLTHSDLLLGYFGQDDLEEGASTSRHAWLRGLPQRATGMIMSAHDNGCVKLLNQICVVILGLNPACQATHGPAMIAG